jgi:hypothetical protein
MVQTPIGLFRIIKDGYEINYNEKELPKKFGIDNNFEVDERYQIEFEQVEKNSVVEFMLETEKLVIIEDKDSDEDLFFSIYNYENLIIGIGVEGDIPGIKYGYVDEKNKHGIKIIVSSECEKKSMKINVPWKKVTNSDQIINVELGLDPTD